AFSPGSYSSAPVLSVSPASLDFGSLSVGQTRDLTVSVRNAGGGSLTGTAAIAPPSAFSVLSGASFALGAGETQTVTVRFAPTAAGEAFPPLAIATNAGDASGGLGGSPTAPNLSVTPASLPFGSVTVGTTKDLTLTLSNGGSAPVAVSALTTAAPFS